MRAQPSLFTTSLSPDLLPCFSRAPSADGVGGNALPTASHPHPSHEIPAFRLTRDPTKNDDVAYDDPSRAPDRRGRARPLERLGAGDGSLHRPHPRHRQSENGFLLRLRALLDHQAGHRPRGVAGRRDHPRHHDQSWPPPLHGPDRSDGPFQQRIISKRWARAWVSNACINTRSCSAWASAPATTFPKSSPARALPPPAYGGVARMSSFGEGIRITPLQLASLVSTLANGGTSITCNIRAPRRSAAKFSAARQAQSWISRRCSRFARRHARRGACTAPQSKATTLTASRPSARPAPATTKDWAGRLGWFVSYADQAHPKIVLVVLLRGGARCSQRSARLRNGRTHLPRPARTKLFRRIRAQRASMPQPSAPRTSPRSSLASCQLVASALVSPRALCASAISSLSFDAARYACQPLCYSHESAAFQFLPLIALRELPSS